MTRTIWFNSVLTDQTSKMVGAMLAGLEWPSLTEPPDARKFRTIVRVTHFTPAGVKWIERYDAAVRNGTYQWGIWHGGVE